MTEETAKALAEAMDNLANAINALPRDAMGIRVNHTNMNGGATTAPNSAPAFTGGRGFSTSP